MGSTFVTRRQAKKANEALGAALPHDRFYLQFVPGIVTHLITSNESPGFSSLRDINAIGAKPHISEDNKNSGTSYRKYYPLFRGLIDTPVKGDQVLLCTIGGVDYYLVPLNTVNSPNWNIDQLQYSGIVRNGQENMSSNNSNRFGVSKNFPIRKHYRLGKLLNRELDFPEGADVEEISVTDIHGDMILEGRHGNSIRLGSRYSSPYIIISNGRPEQSITESAQHDGSIIALLKKGTIHQNFKSDYYLEDEDTENERMVEYPFVLGSDSIVEPKRLIGDVNYDYSYNKHQIFMNSKRVTINSKENDITLSSYNNFHIGSGNNLGITTNGFTTIESSNIYLGNQAKVKRDNQEIAEPLVLGEQLRLLLKEMTNIMNEFKVKGVIGGTSTSASTDMQQRIDNLNNKLDNPNFLSEYHFIEDNGQKPESQQ